MLREAGKKEHSRRRCLVLRELPFFMVYRFKQTIRSEMEIGVPDEDFEVNRHV